MVLYPAENGKLAPVQTYEKGANFNFSKYISVDAQAVAQWVYKHNRHAGSSTNTLPGTKCLYLAIRGTKEVFGVVGIVVLEEGYMSSFEKNLLIAMLNECGLTIDKVKTEENDAVAIQPMILYLQMMKQIVWRR